MELDLSSYFAASLALTFLLLVAEIIMHKTVFVLKFGISCLYIFMMLILIRGYLPFDFYKINLTTSYYSHKVLPFLRTIIFYEINAGGKLVTVKQITITILVVVWTLIICKRTYSYFAFNKYINLAAPCHNARVLRICEDTFYTIFPSKKKYDIKIVRSNIFSSPALFVSSNPIIILPDILYTEEELKFVFYHELIHLKHGDFYVKIAVDFLTPAYWWNLFIYNCLFDIINQAQELYVDYEVNKTLTKKERIVYLKVLSKTADYIYNAKVRRKLIYALTDAQPINMRQRIKCIVSPEVRGLTFKGIIICIVLFVLSFTFVFEPYIQPARDEVGDKIFYLNEELSYYIWDGTNYKLYISDEYVCTTQSIHEDFKELPIYQEELK